MKRLNISILLLFINIIYAPSMYFGSKKYKDLTVEIGAKQAFYAVDFDTSMASASYKFKDLPESAQQQLLCYKLNYYRTNHFLEPSIFPRIPKIFHFIWLGSPLRPEHESNIARYKQLHPDYEIMIWTEEHLKNFGLINQYAFNCAPNYGEKSDIWRYEILERFGGIYCDVGDMICLKNLDQLIYSIDFFAGISNTGIVELNNAIIGSIPYHPILKYCIETLKPFSGKKDTIERTGPWHLTRCADRYLKEFPRSKDILILPVSYLYPLPNAYNSQDHVSEEILQQWIKPESLCVHLWASSWMR